MSYPGAGANAVPVRRVSIAAVIVFTVLIAAALVAIVFSAQQMPAQESEQLDPSSAWVLLGFAGCIVLVIFGILLCNLGGRALANAIERSQGKRFLGMPVPLARWLVPLVAHLLVIGALVAAWLACTQTIATTDESNADAVHTALVAAFLQLAIPPILLALVIMLLVRTIGAARRSNRERRTVSGRLTKNERERQVALAQSAAAVEHAAAFRRTLIEHRVPDVVTVWDIPTREGEVFFADGPVTYARFYGRNVSYSTGGGFFFGSPLFVAAGLAASAIGDASAKSAAEREAREQWRERQQVRLVVSNQRLVCQVGMNWLSFDYGAIAAAYPDVPNHGLVLAFGSAEPLLLQGPAALPASVMAVSAMHGETGLREHPALQALDAPGASPSSPAGATSVPPPQLT